MAFSSSHVWIGELDHEEGWAPKNWWFWTVVLEKTLESPLDSKEIKIINPKGKQLWIFTRRTNTEVPMLWPPDAKSQLIGKDLDAGKDWRQKEKRVAEDEMVGWHYRLSGLEFEQTPGDGEGQGSLVSCSSRSPQSWTQLSDWTTKANERLESKNRLPRVEIGYRKWRGEKIYISARMERVEREVERLQGRDSLRKSYERTGLWLPSFISVIASQLT